jgi:hypothetical protein
MGRKKATAEEKTQAKIRRCEKTKMWRSHNKERSCAYNRAWKLKNPIAYKAILKRRRIKLCSTEKGKQQKREELKRWKKRYPEKVKLQRKRKKLRFTQNYPELAQARIQEIKRRYGARKRNSEVLRLAKNRHRQRARDELRLGYIRQYFFKGVKDVPLELLQVKALQLKIKRNLKEKYADENDY